MTRQAQKSSVRPTVISDLKYGSTWYISGGNSTTGRLFKDAGAAYVFADLKNSGSVPLPFETVFDKGQHADYWFIKYNQKTEKLIRNWKGNLLLMLVSMRLRIIAFMDAIPIIFLFMKSHLFIPNCC